MSRKILDREFVSSQVDHEYIFLNYGLRCEVDCARNTKTRPRVGFAAELCVIQKKLNFVARFSASSFERVSADYALEACRPKTACSFSCTTKFGCKVLMGSKK